MSAEWQHYRGQWHGSYFMKDGRMFAHVTQYGTSVPSIVLRLPRDGGFARYHPSILPRDIAAARASAEKRLALTHPELFAQRELEV